jgi:hypothetical protein
MDALIARCRNGHHVDANSMEYRLSSNRRRCVWAWCVFGRCVRGNFRWPEVDQKRLRAGAWRCRCLVLPNLQSLTSPGIRFAPPGEDGVPGVEVGHHGLLALPPTPPHKSLACQWATGVQRRQGRLRRRFAGMRLDGAEHRWRDPGMRFLAGTGAALHYKNNNLSSRTDAPRRRGADPGPTHESSWNSG